MTPEGPMPQDGAPAESGGGVEEVIQDIGMKLTKLSEVFGQNEQFPPELKEALMTATQAYEAFASGLSQMAGGGAPEGASPGAVSPEQGGSGAQPMSMGRPG